MLCLKTDFCVTWLLRVAKCRCGWERALGSRDSAAAATPATRAWSPQQTWSSCRVRQAMADVIQQVHNELNNTVSGRLDMLSGINTASHRVTAKPAPRPNRISDIIPRNWERQQRQGRVQRFHVGPALVDASIMVQRRRDNDGQH